MTPQRWVLSYPQPLTALILVLYFAPAYLERVGGKDRAGTLSPFDVAILQAVKLAPSYPLHRLNVRDRERVERVGWAVLTGTFVDECDPITPESVYPFAKFWRDIARVPFRGGTSNRSELKHYARVIHDRIAVTYEGASTAGGCAVSPDLMDIIRWIADTSLGLISEDVRTGARVIGYDLIAGKFYTLTK